MEADPIPSSLYSAYFVYSFIYCLFFALIANQIRALVRGFVPVGYREIRRKDIFQQKE